MRSACLELVQSWWPGNGNARDVVGGYDGTLMNGATFANGFVTGGNGQAFSFDGTDDWINVQSAPAASTFTIETWVFIGPVNFGYRTIYAGSFGLWLRSRRITWFQGAASM